MASEFSDLKSYIIGLCEMYGLSPRDPEAIDELIYLINEPEEEEEEEEEEEKEIELNNIQ